MANPSIKTLTDDMTCFDCTVQDDIAHIVLSRPEQLNSMIPAFWSELPVLLEALDASGDVRVVVISSSGKHFSAGMDLSVFANMANNFAGEPARCAESMRRNVLQLQAVFNAIENLRVPVLAAIHGGAIGGAVDMISAADCRYCTKDTFFTIKETQIGMTADLGTLQRLPHLIPQGIMRELAYTGRNWSAQEAMAHGFVNQVFEDKQSMLDEVMAIAKSIATNSPMAVHGCKEMINYARDHSVFESLNYMATWQAGMFQMADVHEAMAAQKEKRLPKFEALRAKNGLMDKE